MLYFRNAKMYIYILRKLQYVPDGRSRVNVVPIYKCPRVGTFNDFRVFRNGADISRNRFAETPVRSARTQNRDRKRGRVEIVDKKFALITESARTFYDRSFYTALNGRFIDTERAAVCRTISPAFVLYIFYRLFSFVRSIPGRFNYGRVWETSRPKTRFCALRKTKGSRMREGNGTISHSLPLCIRWHRSV